MPCVRITSHLCRDGLILVGLLYCQGMSAQGGVLLLDGVGIPACTEATLLSAHTDACENSTISTWLNGKTSATYATSGEQ